MKRTLLAACAIIAMTSMSTESFAADNFRFGLVRSSASPACVPNARAVVTISPSGEKETMHVEISGLRPNVGFDVFVTQVPEFPFGMAWYQGDITTDANGFGVADFEGRFNKETFVVALGAAPAPVLHWGVDANVNPPTNGPIHMFHVGIWFNRPADAVAAGCAAGVTPFNGDHNAGVQVLNSKNFPIGAGPLRRVQ